MLRSGLILLVVSSLGVTLQTAGFLDIHTLAFKLACSLALTVSAICFMATYCLAEFAHSKPQVHKS